MNRFTFGALFALACLARGTATAQHNRWEVSLASGLSIPNGPFAHVDATGGGSTAFSERTGWNLDARATYRFWHGWGATVLAGYQENPYMESGRGKWYRLMAGPSYRLTPDKKWALTARALAGVERYDLKPGTPEVAPFTLEGGVGAQYGIGKRWFIQATADYVDESRHLYGSVVVTSNEITYYAYRYKWAYFITDLGIGLRL